MVGSDTMGSAYDPERHESQVVAVFEDRRMAEAARNELLNAGVPAGVIRVVDQEAGTGAGAGDQAGAPVRERGGFWHAISDLFAPDREVDAYGEALFRGHAMVIVRPQDGAERETVIEVLEGRGPIDLEERGGAEPAATVQVDHRQLNHAALSRADVEAQRIAGRAQAGVDTAGQPVAPVVEAAPAPRVTYTYGVPDEIAGAMSLDEQIEAQRPATAAAAEPAERDYVRIVEERLRVGWREQHARAVRVRSYVAEKRPAAERVQMFEEEIEHDLDRRDA